MPRWSAMRRCDQPLRWSLWIRSGWVSKTQARNRTGMSRSASRVARVVVMVGVG